MDIHIIDLNDIIILSLQRVYVRVHVSVSVCVDVFVRQTNRREPRND